MATLTLICVLLFLSNDARVLIRSPKTGEIPEQAIVEDSDHNLRLVSLEGGKETHSALK